MRRKKITDPPPVPPLWGPAGGGQLEPAPPQNTRPHAVGGEAAPGVGLPTADPARPWSAASVLEVWLRENSEPRLKL